MRSYGQYCAVAKALDAVGDRWTLLIIRELAVLGACRYTDLRNGLPGIATNLLANRLRELESAGLIRREDAPPPVATTLFRLTEAGEGLWPVIDALGKWGTRYMAAPADGDEFRVQWLMFPATLFLRDHQPDAPAVSIELRAAGSPVAVEVSDGSVHATLGAAAAPDLVVEGAPQLILGLMSGGLSPADATHAGLRITGDTSVLDRVLPQPSPAA